MLSHDAPGEKCHTNTTRAEHKSVTLAHQARAQKCHTSRTSSGKECEYKVVTRWIKYKLSMVQGVERVSSTLTGRAELRVLVSPFTCHLLLLPYSNSFSDEDEKGCHGFMVITCDYDDSTGFPPITPSQPSQIPMSPNMALSR